MEPIVVNADGTALLSYERGREPDPAELDAPLPFALVAATHQGRIVVVHNEWHDVWELPGGMIDPGETARQAAVRELSEETAIEVAEVSCHGTMLVEMGGDGRREYGVLYTVELASDQLPLREADAEISAVRWWSPGEQLPGLVPLDAWLAEDAVGRR